VTVPLLARGLVLRRWAFAVPFLVGAACGGPQSLGGRDKACFRDDDCKAGLICVAPLKDPGNRVCSNDPTPLISSVEGPPIAAPTGGAATGGAAPQAGAAGMAATAAGAATGGTASAGSASAGSAGTSGSAGTNSAGGTAGSAGTSATAGTAAEAGAPP
jgi:hypothetical protein